MVRERTFEEFRKFLACRIELFDKFCATELNDNPVDRTNQVLFKEEFTFDNWIEGKIGQRLYSTGYKEITTNPKIFGKEYQTVPPISLDEGFRYSIYRFIPYNFERVINERGKIKKVEDFIKYKNCSPTWKYGKNKGEYTSSYYCKTKFEIHSNLKQKLNCKDCCELSEEEKKEILKHL